MAQALQGWSLECARQDSCDLSQLSSTVDFSKTLAHGLFPLLSFPLKTFLVHSRLCFSGVHALLFHFQSTLPRKSFFALPEQS